jgi:small subunit ribosomal protein S8
MAVTDPIADMLTRVRNAISAHHDTVGMPTSKTKVSLAKVLKEEGFIEDYTVAKGSGPQGELKVALHYDGEGAPAIVGIKRVSKPGLRVYVGKGEIPRFYGGLGVAILSTSKGVMTGKQARTVGVGGEVLCHVW